MPVFLVERGRLPTLTTSYFWMMIAPAVLVAIVLAYQWNVRVDRRSSIALIVIGIGTGLYPLWGPPFLPDMIMRLDWIGTVLSMYVPGLLIVVAGLLQFRFPHGEPLGRYRSRSRSTS